MAARNHLKHAWLVTGDRGMAGLFSRTLAQVYQVHCREDYSQALDDLSHAKCHVMFIDLALLEKVAGGAGKALFHKALQPVFQVQPSAYLVGLAPSSHMRQAVQAVRAGMDDYLSLPLSGPEILLALERFQEVGRLEAELEYLRDQFWRQEDTPAMKTQSPILQEVYRNVRSVAPTRSSVLLTGETGVGKSFMAQLIHRHSQVADGPFIAVHCGAIPDALLESDLFGHEKGSFTGAIKRKLGRFETAHGGTIFLDEIGTISPAAQVKLLQVLQDGVIQRVGGEALIKVNVRVISATNEDLKALCDAGSFRKDLFYRLNVFPIEIPSLRERKQDIAGIVESLLERLSREHGKVVRGIEPDALRALEHYAWPGNFRELENVVERAFILARGPHLSINSFPLEIAGAVKRTDLAPPDTSISLAEGRAQAIETYERRYLDSLLRQKRGRIQDVADAAGIGVRQLHKLMQKLDLDKANYKEH